METIPELKELNLDDNEIRVYLACLSLGSAKVHEIAKRTDLIRTTTYGVLRSLIGKGLVSTVLRDNVTFFQAAEPKQLLQILEEKKKRIATVVPKLEQLKTLVPMNHKVELFEGKDGLKTLFNDYVSVPNTTVKIIGFMSKWPDFFGVWTDMYYRRKKENRVKSLAILDESERKFAKDRRVVNTEFRYLPWLDIDAECFIYADKVAFASFRPEELKGVIIQDKGINAMHGKLFDTLWKQAKP